MTADSRSNLRMVNRLLLVVAGMFAFGFAMVPLYDVFCDITGLNGKTGGRASVASIEADLDRTVTVEFIASVNQSMPWDFEPEVTRMEGQAIPSVAPGVAAPHFKKTECFCFTEQEFSAGEGRDMPLLFMVDPELPDDVGVVTLSYTFFDKQKALN